MRICAYTKDLSEQLSTQLSSLLAQEKKNLVDGSVHMSVQTSNSSQQRLCQKENQRTNRELGQSCMELNVCLKWLIVSLMVHQLSTVITADCQEILCDVWFFFSALNKTEITPRSSFVVKKIHLIAHINYNYVGFSSSYFLLHSRSRKLLYCRSPGQVCFCVTASIVKSPSC